MLNIAAQRRIWLYTQPTDMRRSFDGLSALVRNHLGEDPTSGHWFAFLNRRATQIKVLAFEEDGYLCGATPRAGPVRGAERRRHDQAVLVSHRVSGAARRGGHGDQKAAKALQKGGERIDTDIIFAVNSTG